MTKEYTKCYLCAADATQIDNPNEARGVIVQCEGMCVNRYSVTFRALEFYLDYKREEPLTADDRLKLSEYVNKQDVPGGQVVPINTDVIKKVTGKESVHYR